MNRRTAIATLAALPAVERIVTANPSRDDVILVECSAYLRQEGIAHVKTQVEKVWPNRRVLVLGPDVRIKLTSA